MIIAAMTAVPLAAGLDWLEGVLPVLFVLFWIVSQIVNAVQQAGKGRRPPPLRPAAKPERVDQVRTELERQIEEFLGGGRPRAERPRTDEPRDGRPPRPTVPPRPRAPQPAVKARGPRTGGGAAVAGHVQEAFAHELEHIRSSLEKDVMPPADPRRPAAAVPAAELTAALRNPATLRQLILLREVLDRPVERW